MDRFRVACCNPRVRLLTTLAFLGLGLLLGGCSSSSKAKTAADADVKDEPGWDSGSNQASGGGTAPQTTGNPSGPSVVNYPAFEVLRDGSSVISIQVRGPVQVSEQKAQGRIIYSLNGVAVPEKVNRLPMLTQHFPTQVTSITLEQGTGTGANLIIDLREPSTSTFKLTKNEAGTMLTIALPRSAKYSQSDKTDDPTSFERPSDAPGDDVVGAENEDQAAEGYSKETERRRRKSKRQPKPYVERPLTLPYRTLAPDVAVSLAGVDDNDPVSYLSSGVRYGIIDEFEIEATPHAFRLTPNPAFAYPSLGFTAGYTGHVFEIAGRARFFIPVDSALPGGDAGNNGALMLGAPMAIHLDRWGRIDTGGFVTLYLPKSGGDVVAGLIQQQASPFYTDAGVPLNFLFQPDPAFWFGIHHGFSVYDFNEAGETFALPLGVELGITASDDFNPIADFSVRADLPRLLLPGRDGDLSDENVYQLAAWFRWFYHL